MTVTSELRLLPELWREGGERMTETRVAYVCDGYGCKRTCAVNGYADCSHTTDVRHAKNFMHYENIDKHMEIPERLTDREQEAREGE